MAMESIGAGTRGMTAGPTRGRARRDVGGRRSGSGRSRRQTMPALTAYATACDRFLRFSRLVTSWMTFLIVRSEYASTLAISLVPKPIGQQLQHLALATAQAVGADAARRQHILLQPTDLVQQPADQIGRQACRRPSPRRRLPDRAPRGWPRGAGGHRRRRPRRRSSTRCRRTAWRPRPLVDSRRAGCHGRP